ncbi:hypothetical protein B0H11DRAFT_2252103 [Mycena galericulata]|nr:hypothetical protein B0H11DRAFT_2252103 [Mycena galericulata]
MHLRHCVPAPRLCLALRCSHARICVAASTATPHNPAPTSTSTPALARNPPPAGSPHGMGGGGGQSLFESKKSSLSWPLNAATAHLLI